MKTKLNLFRAKRLFDDKWIIGYYVPITDFESGEESAGLISRDAYLYSYGEASEIEFVDPDTVGQFIGTDQKGGCVFEGDILESIYKKKGLPPPRILISDIRNCSGVIQCIDHYRVIGNIYDNPDLFKSFAK